MKTICGRRRVRMKTAGNHLGRCWFTYKSCLEQPRSGLSRKVGQVSRMPSARRTLFSAYYTRRCRRNSPRTIRNDDKQVSNAFRPDQTLTQPQWRDLTRDTNRQRHNGRALSPPARARGRYARRGDPKGLRRAGAAGEIGPGPAQPDAPPHLFIPHSRCRRFH